MYQLYNQHLQELQVSGKYRQLPELNFLSKPCLDFSSNDYLSFQQKEELMHAAAQAAYQHGIGATGSRLLSGNKIIFEKLEARIAQDKGTESALVFNSGFQANVSVLASLLDQKVLKTQPLVFFDRLNHASLYQAMFLSKAVLIRYRHNDMQHLSVLLASYQKDLRPKFIVTETLFGMDGDILPIQQVVALAARHHAFLYLDEAHATGVIGNHGYGLSTTVTLKEIPHVVMGTFSKALGCSGAYIACNQILKDYLINKAAGFIYSTAISPMLIGAVSKAWELVRTLDKERQQLFSLAQFLRGQLLGLGLNIGNSTSHIIPILLGEENFTMQSKQQLLQKGIMVSSIRPPTVPPGASRLRIALNVSHTKQDIDFLISNLKKL